MMSMRVCVVLSQGEKFEGIFHSKSQFPPKIAKKNKHEKNIKLVQIIPSTGEILHELRLLKSPPAVHP